MFLEVGLVVNDEITASISEDDPFTDSYLQYRLHLRIKERQWNGSGGIIKVKRLFIRGRRTNLLVHLVGADWLIGGYFL